MARWSEPGRQNNNQTRPKNNKGQKKKKRKCPALPKSKKELKKMPKKRRRTTKKRIMKYLIEEVREGNVETIRRSIDILPPDSITKALNQAVSAGNLGAVRLIINYHYPMSSRWCRAWCGGFYMLHDALVKGHVEIAKVLLQKGMRVVMKKSKTTTPLQLAIATRDIDLVQMVIQSDPSSVNWAAIGGWTPLHEAADTGDLRMVELLLHHGAVPESDECFQPLHVACLKQHPKIVHFLLPQHTPVLHRHDASEIRMEELWSLNFALLIAAGGEKEEIVESLLLAGADPNFSMPCDLTHEKYAFSVKFGYTPLHMAQKNVLIQRILLNRGATMEGPNVHQSLDEEKAISSAAGKDIKKEVNPEFGDNSLMCALPIKKEQILDFDEDSLKRTSPVKTDPDIGEGSLTCTVPIKTEKNLDLDEDSSKCNLPVKTEKNPDFGEGDVLCTLPIKIEKN